MTLSLDRYSNQGVISLLDSAKIFLSHAGEEEEELGLGFEHRHSHHRGKIPQRIWAKPCVSESFLTLEVFIRPSSSSLQGGPFRKLNFLTPTPTPAL